jgi:threonine dehydrogenase-like Zn-dependent dehydrogenase
MPRSRTRSGMRQPRSPATALGVRGRRRRSRAGAPGTPPPGRAGTSPCDAGRTCRGTRCRPWTRAGSAPTASFHKGVRGKAAERLIALTGGKGVDVAIETVGAPATFELCQDIVAAGGHIANVGVSREERHAQAREALGSQRHPDDAARRHGHDTDALEAVLAGRLKPRLLIPHEFRLDEMMRAYGTFGDAAKNKALEVTLRAG